MAPVKGLLSNERYNQFRIEEKVKEFWAENNVYKLVKEKSEKSPRKLYFLDGPPYASAKSIHVGTAWNKIIKDTLLRYYRMRGYFVWDKPGFDTHGLPIEVKVEQMFGIKSKKEIEKLGIDKFVEACKNFAKENIEAMTQHFKEIGVFMDWENPYITYKDDYIESGWWLIKRAHEEGLLYKGYRVVHWCPRCETTLADYEVSEYRDLEDPSVYVKFPVVGREKEYLLIWTTTPWTLPANAFVMVHPDLEYVRVRVGGEVLILARARLEHVMSEAGITDYEVLETIKGSELAGTRYVHPLEDLVDAQRILRDYHVVVAAPDAVTAGEGTGLVHSAPGHGEIDFEVNEKLVGAPVISLVDEQGRMTREAGKYAGLYFRTEANKAIIEDLRARNALFHESRIVHRYPVCWRCKTPLVLRATDQWFIAVRRLRDKLIEEAFTIEWRPAWAKTRFINLLKDVKDWVISRQRYWGIPLPIWVCEKCGYTHVIGSVDEIVEMGGEKPEQLHRPWIDRVTLKCPKCGGTMRRVRDVLDVWFDSGVAFYASLGYPRVRELYEKLKPVDFIVEGHDQIRGWFFSLLRSGVIGFGEKPYLRVLVHGFVLDEKGREMHKSLGNYVPFEELISRVPRDVVRLWSLTNVTWEDPRFSWKALSFTGRVFNIIWNVFAFADTYMAMDSFDPVKVKLEDVRDALLTEDRWILSRLNTILKKYKESMEDLRPHEAARLVREFIVEDVSHWYIRLIRRRVWEEEQTPSKIAAYVVLYHVLRKWLLMAAPIIPFTTEYLYQMLVRPAEEGAPVSVHLLDMPEVDESFINEELEEAMDVAKKIVEAAASARSKAGIKLRRPVKRVIIALRDEKARRLVPLVKDIISRMSNAKDVEVVGYEFFEEHKIYDVEPNYRAIGPEFKKLTAKVAEYIIKNKEIVAKDIVTSGAHEAEMDGERVTIEARHVNLKIEYPEWLSVVETPIGLVAVDTRLSEQEIIEGLAREVTRRIQAMRKELSLPVDAYIEAWISADGELRRAVEAMKDYIMRETRAVRLEIGEPPRGEEGYYFKEWDVDGERLRVWLRRVERRK